MLTVILKILSLLGIVLLALLCAALLALFMVLFFPVGYRLEGRRDEDGMCLEARASWLFGFLRARFSYPEPGTAVVKLLCFRLGGQGKKRRERAEKKGAGRGRRKKTPLTEEAEDSEDGGTQGSAGGHEEAGPAGEEAGQSGPAAKAAGETSGETGIGGPAANAADGSGQTRRPVEDVPGGTKEAAGEPSPEGGAVSADSGEGLEQDESRGFFGRISAKIEKLKYTIIKIYGKIKDILENIAFYRKLLSDESTRELFGHAWFRLGRVLKSIRPRRIKADLRFGASSPDTTGYLYGIYGMLSPKLGKDICVVPDFEQAVLEGELSAAGHITVCSLLYHGFRLLLDKRLRIFLRRLRAHGASQK